MSGGLLWEENHSDLLNNLNPGIAVNKYRFAVYEKPSHLCCHSNASESSQAAPSDSAVCVALLYLNAN